MKTIIYKNKEYQLDTNQEPMYFQNMGYKYKVVAQDGEIKFLTPIQIGLKESKRGAPICYDNQCAKRKLNNL